MKKAISVFIIIVLLLCGCSYDMFGHETYTSVDDYKAAFELSEIRFPEARDELFPTDVTNLNIEKFYFEWELGFVGSADVEMLLSVNYDNDSFHTEISRLKLLADGNVKFDENNFLFPAYVTILGMYQTSVYALVDDNTFTIHYVYVQLTDKARIDIGEDLLPYGYYGFGDVVDNSYDVYSTNK